MQVIIMKQLSSLNILSNIKPLKYHHCGKKFGLLYNRFKLPPLRMAASFPLACNRYVVQQGRGEKLIACAFPPCPAQATLCSSSHTYNLFLHCIKVKVCGGELALCLSPLNIHVGLPHKLVEIYAKCFGLNKLLKCLRLTFTRNVVWLFEKSFMVYPEDVEVIAIGWVRIESSRAGTKQPWSPPDINLKNKESDRVSR